MAKHRSDVHLKKETGTTGLTMHAVKESHTFNFDDVTILEQIPSYWQNVIAEKMFIHKTTNTVNTQIDKSGLHASYINLMKLHSTTNHRPSGTRFLTTLRTTHHRHKTDYDSSNTTNR